MSALRRLWDLKITYDGLKDNWFLVGFACGFVTAVLGIGFAQGWLPLSH